MNIFLIPTVISPETQDEILSPQIIEVIKAINIFFVEDIRTARRFISSLKINKSIDAITFYELNKDTPESQTKHQIKNLPADAGILSEAGCPGIADPGAVAVALAHQNGYKVIPLVGPSAIILALMASGLNGQKFAFHGYLPIDKTQKIKELQRLEHESKLQNQTQIFMETPYRNNQLLADILQHCRAETQLCIASNITAKDAFIQTKSIGTWKKHHTDLHKKPTIFILLLK